MNGYVVLGDVHNEGFQLEKIVNKFTKENYKIILLGDLLNKGINPLKTLEVFDEIKNDIIFIPGNHEHKFLKLFNLESNKNDKKLSLALNTYNSLINLNKGKYLFNNYYDYIKELNVFKEIGDFIFVHAEYSDIYFNPKLKYIINTDKRLYGSHKVLNNKKYFSFDWIDNIKNKIVFVGHLNLNNTKPVFIENKVVNMDTGSGYFDGYLSFVKIDKYMLNNIKEFKKYLKNVTLNVDNKSSILYPV